MSTQSKQLHRTGNKRGSEKVLTIAVHVDQSRAENLNGKFAIPVESQLRQIESDIADRDEREQFARCAELGRDRIRSYAPNAKSLLLFIRADGDITVKELNIELPPGVWWSDQPHLQPLLEARDEFEELLVVLLDSSHSRFLSSYMGTLMEHPVIHNPYPRAHTQAPGNDQTKSQSAFHHKADDREHRYMKAVAAEAQRIATIRLAGKIVLAGNNRPCKELYSLLPESIRNRVIAVQVLPVDASISDITSAVAHLQFQAEREEESAKCAALIEHAAKHERAVTGIRETMAALTSGRIHELIYAQGFSPAGSSCRNCGLLVINATVCTACGTSLDAGEPIMDHILETALESGSAIEQVRGEAAEKLRSFGGIGAFLRY
jgi:hypothetical protein